MDVFSGKSRITYFTHNLKVQIFFEGILLGEHILIVIFLTELTFSSLWNVLFIYSNSPFLKFDIDINIAIPLFY